MSAATSVRVGEGVTAEYLRDVATRPRAARAPAAPTGRNRVRARRRGDAPAVARRPEARVATRSVGRAAGVKPRERPAA